LTGEKHTTPEPRAGTAAGTLGPPERASRGPARARAALLAVLVGILLGVVLVGCGSSGSSAFAGSRDAAGVRAVAQRLAAAAAAGRYGEACELLTLRARTSFTRFRGGCPGEVQYLYLALRGELSKWIATALPNLQIEGDSAIFEGRVQARYENGAWHLEAGIF